jgi:5-methylcytosine-specific restriction endonuclease McrA
MKDYAKQFYTSRAWASCRAAYRRQAGGLCERCYKKGLITPGEIVHHKIHITPENINNPDIVLDWGNLELVCRDCHAEIHGKKKKRFTVDENGRVDIPLCDG